MALLLSCSSGRYVLRYDKSTTRKEKQGTYFNLALVACDFCFEFLVVPNVLLLQFGTPRAHAAHNSFLKPERTEKSVAQWLKCSACILEGRRPPARTALRGGVRGWGAAPIRGVVQAGGRRLPPAQ
jgi:hypothetical protein